METAKRYVLGKHDTREIRWHLAVLVVVFWGLVLCARLGYPARNNFSIFHEMLSGLGSFDNGHNPDWYWVFSMALIFCGITTMPVMLYVHRKFAAVARIGAVVGTFFMLAGCVALIFVGLFSYAPGNFLGIWPLKSLHVSAALLAAIAFLLGSTCYALLLFKDRFTAQRFACAGRLPYLRFAGPYLLCVPPFVLIASKIRWAYLYIAVHAALHGAGQQATEAMHKAASRLPEIAIAEHLGIWATTIFVVWFTLMLPNASESD